MDYYVYENWRVRPDKAVVHIGSCPFCKNGKGLSGKGTKPSNGKWDGPFDLKKDAVNRARACGRCQIKLCAACNP